MTTAFRCSALILLLTGLATPLNGQELFSEPTSRPEFKIEVLEESFEQLIDSDSKIMAVGEGFTWTEGPVWNKTDQALLFSDVPNNKIYRVMDRKLSVFLTPSGFDGESSEKEPGSNGLAYDGNGRLIVCDHGNRRVYRLEKDGTRTTLAEKYNGKRFNSPNDLVIKSNGDIFFTDPPYGLKDKKKQELGFFGVFCLKPDGKVQLVTDELIRPNGVALSPDEKTLYVAQSHKPAAIYMKYSIQDDGNFSKGEVLFDASDLAKKDRGSPDGIKVDVEGNLWATGPGGVLVISPKGKLLGRILTGTPTANCNFIDNGKTLAMTAGKSILMVNTKTQALGDWGRENPNLLIPTEVVQQIESKIQSYLLMLENEEHEKLLLQVLPSDFLQKLKDDGEFENILQAFSESKAERLETVLNEISFTKAKYDPKSEEIQFEAKRPLIFQKLKGEWIIRN